MIPERADRDRISDALFFGISAGAKLEPGEAPTSDRWSLQGLLRESRKSNAILTRIAEALERIATLAENEAKGHRR